MYTRESQQSNPAEGVSAKELSENMDPADGWISYTSYADEDHPDRRVGIVLMVDGQQVGDCIGLSSSEDDQDVLRAQMVCDGIADALNAGAGRDLIIGVMSRFAEQLVSPINLDGYKLMDSYLSDVHRTTVYLRADTDDVLIREGYFNIDYGSAKAWLGEELDPATEPEADL